MSTDAGPERKELKAQWQAEVTVPEYTLKDVALHKTKDDIWIVIHGKVYNITDYVQDHPGGADALLEVAGTDATAPYEDVGHSEDAQEIMNPYLVGILKDASAAQFARPQAVRVVRRSATVEQKQDSSSLQKAGYTLLALGTAGLGFYAARHIRHIDLRSHSLPNFNFAKALLSNDHAFIQGFVVASVASGAIGVAILKRVKEAFDIAAGFQRYPPYKKASPVIPSHQPTGWLMPKTYKRIPLIEREELSSTAVRLVFALPTKDAVLGLPIGQHVAIRATVDNDEVVTRSYTPTSNNTDLGRLELVIRIYDDGLLTGKYLSKLQIGDEVEFRGPKGAMKYRKGWAKKIGMIAGGTGITPMYQLIRAICEDDTDLTEVSLIYANRTEEDILLRRELERFARGYPMNLKLYYTLDQPSESWTGGKGFVTKELMAERLPAPSADLKVLLCGPPGMVNASKKALAELGFEAPGAVSKMTDQIFCF